MTRLPTLMSTTTRPLFTPAALSLAAALCAWPAHGSEPGPGKAETRIAAKADARPSPEAAKPASADKLDALRERLAEKLGANRSPQPGNSSLLRVTSRLEAPTGNADSHGRPLAVPGAAPRKASPAVLAAVDAHRNAKAATAALTSASLAAAASSAQPAGWAYLGATGPAAWGGLKPEFSTCAVGQRQSPIDIRGGIVVDLEPVRFDYRASAFNVIDNGQTVQVNLGPGNSIQVGARRYELVQFHFHRPSEERIDGRQYDMDVHLVHRDPEGRLAVVAVLLERGAAQSVVQAVWNNLPLEKGEEQPASVVLDLNHLLPPDRGYYTYMGSLTTPPCSEGVLWLVMRQPVPVSQGQIDIFARLYPFNARPVQSASGRLIKQSQ